MASQPNATAGISRLFSATNVVLLLICLMYGITYIDRVNVSTAASVFKQELHLSNTQVGFVFSAFAWPYLVFQVIGGWVSDRFGARRALTICAVIWGGATLLTGLAGSFLTIVAARVLLGFGEGATFPTATRAMSDWFPQDKRAFSQGVTHSSARLGNALTPPLVAWLITLVTWRGSFMILGVISIGWAIWWGMYFRDDPRSHKEITSQELDGIPDYGLRAQHKKEPVPWLALCRRMAPVTIVYFCYGWTLWLYLAWIPQFFLHRYNLKLAKSALFAAGVFLAGVIGDTAGGVLSDSILRKTGDRNKARRNLVVLGFLLLARLHAADLVPAQPWLGRDLPQWRVLLLRVHHWTHVGDSHGYHAPVCGLRERPDECRFRVRRDCLPCDRWLDHRQDRQLGTAFPRKHCAAAFRIGARFLDETE